MVKNRKGHNWKGRQVVQTVIDDTDTKKIQLDLNVEGSYDQSNVLVLPSKKRKTKIKNDKPKVTRILSKKKRKELEKVVQKKQKKANRASLLEALSQVQATPEELNQLTSISTVQTKGLKRYFRELEAPEKVKKRQQIEHPREVKVNSIAGAKRQRLNLTSTQDPIVDDPNVLGFEESGDSEDEDSESETNSDKEPEEPKSSKSINEDLRDKEEGDNEDLGDKEEGDNPSRKDEGDSEVNNADCNKTEPKPEIKLEENKTKPDRKPAVFVNVNRKPSIQKARLKLPILAEEQQIMETINENPVVILAGETGSGKTTQVPQFLYEAGYALNKMIGVTEPRRVAAISMSQRVGQEMNLSSQEVSYLIRFEGNVTENSKIKFMTDGVLLKEVQTDFLLSKYSVIILDEAHERSVYTDILIGLLSRIVPLRHKRGDPLKLIVMSATLRLEDFVENERLFKKRPPVIKVEARQFPVTVHFNRRTNEDYLREAFNKTVKIHTKLPDGGILVFVTGQQEVRTLLRRLRKAFPVKNTKKNSEVRSEGSENEEAGSEGEEDGSSKGRGKIKEEEEEVRIREEEEDVRIKEEEESELAGVEGGCTEEQPELQEKDQLEEESRKNHANFKNKKTNFRKGRLKSKKPNYKIEATTTKDPGKLNNTTPDTLKAEESEDDSSSELEEHLKKKLRKKKNQPKPVPRINLDDYSVPGDDEPNSEPDSDSLSEDDDVTEITSTKPLWVLPLFSLLPSEKQAQIFKPPPKGYRLCIVSTNVAETSLTIPNIKYVVDTGKEKVKLYDKVTGVTSYMVTWTSKASADQRAGRAGRLGPGHCYRLYSSAVFNDTFKQFSIPEIQQKPVDDLFLKMKCMNIDKVANFPFPTAPDLLQLSSAEERLEVLGVLKESKVTQLGRAVVKFPVLPRFGKMLALSHQQDLLPYTICLVAALSVQEVLLETPVSHTTPEETKATRQKWAALRRQWAGMSNSLLLGDPMVLLKAVGAAEYANSQGKLEDFCNENGLRQKALIEIRKLRMQLTNEINLNVPGSDVVVDPKLTPASDVQAKFLRQILLAGMGDQIAKKIMPEELKNGQDKIKFKYAYRANNLEEPVFLHQGSVLKRTLPEFVVFQEIYETNKMYMRGVTAIEADWLPIFVPNACQLSSPLQEPAPRYDSTTDRIYCTVSGTFGPQAWVIPVVEIEFPNTNESYKWFARFLLEGKVFNKLEKYTKILLNRPEVMVKTWARLQPRTEVLLRALLAKEVRSRKQLEDEFQKNPKYLLSEYLRWVPQSAYGEVTFIWPPID